MACAFPQETVDDIASRIMQLKIDFPDDFLRTYAVAKTIARCFFNTTYGFLEQLHTGHYAPYPHERKQLLISGDNCTTIIPSLYIHCAVLGLKPEIVQFFRMRDITTRQSKNLPCAGSHFAVTVDAGRKHRYLLDPFYRTFGPIREQTEKYMKIGSGFKHKAKIREFDHICSYTPEQFAQMMDRLHDDAESLDMLVAGQKVYDSKKYNKTVCSLWVYYNEDTNTVTTRLYIPQIAIHDKFIFCNMHMDDLGNVQKTDLEFIVAKEYGWDTLVGAKKVVRIDDLSLQSPQSKNKAGSSLEGAERLYAALDSSEKRTIHSMVCARTLYEYELTRSGKKYVSPLEEHDTRILDLRDKEIAFREKEQPFNDILWFHDWKLKKVSRRESRRARAYLKRCTEKKGEIIKEINALNRMRQDNTPEYHRIMDQVLFARELSSFSEEQLDHQVHILGLDTRTGYFSMVRDFVPYALAAKDDLMLKQFMGPLKKKITALRARKCH